MPSWISNPFSDNLTGVKLIGANLALWFNTGVQTLAQAPHDFGHDFRVWSSWAVSIVVGVLTAIKIRNDIRRNNEPNDDE